VVALTLAAAGCATTDSAEPTVKRVWPLPPDAPRIEYVRSFSQPRDLGKKRSWLLGAARYLFGEGKEPVMLRPYGVALDAAGRVYVSDTGLQVVHIYDFDRKDYRQVFWIERGQTRLASPVGLAIDDQGMLYVADSELNRIFVYEPGKRELVQTIGTPGQFTRLGGLAYNRKNKLIYGIDAGAHRVFALDLSGKEVLGFGARGQGDGQLNFPTHVWTDDNGAVYVTDSLNFRVQIFEPDGKFVSKLGRLGNTLGSFSKPKGVAVDGDGHIYVVDGIYDTVQIFNSNGQLLLNFGHNGEQPGDFWLPAGIAIDRKNQIYIADTYNQRVQVFRYLPGPES
jgi:DNA-binding beta-propeller fold protein YncE